jgi:hypothetical protein
MIIYYMYTHTHTHQILFVIENPVLKLQALLLELY